MISVANLCCVASLWNRRPEELKLIRLFVDFWFMLRPCRTIVLKLVYVIFKRLIM